MELPRGQQGSTVTQYPDVENFLPEPELILSIFQRDYFFVTVIQKLILIVLELIS